MDWTQNLRFWKMPLSVLIHSLLLQNFKGSALDADGVMREGFFVEAGPISWFLSEDEKIAGLTNTNKELRSQIIPGTASVDSIKKLGCWRECFYYVGSYHGNGLRS